MVFANKTLTQGFLTQSRFCSNKARKKTNLRFDWNVIESVHNCWTCWCIPSLAKQKWLIFKHSSMMMHALLNNIVRFILKTVLKICTLERTINARNKKVSIFTEGEIHFMAVSKNSIKSQLLVNSVMHWNYYSWSSIQKGDTWDLLW